MTPIAQLLVYGLPLAVLACQAIAVIDHWPVRPLSLLSPLYNSPIVSISALLIALLALRRGEIVPLLKVGLFFEAVRLSYLLVWRQVPFAETLSAVGLSFWFASLFISGWKFLTGCGPERRRALDDGATKFALLGLFVLGHSLVAWTARYLPWTFDNYFYAFDGLLPFPIAQTIEKTVSSRRWAWSILEVVYYSLFVVAFAFIRMQYQNGTSSGHLLSRWLLVGLLGFGLYFIVPGVGPKVAFYLKANASLPVPANVPLALMHHGGSEPRNAMPSLHTAWAFLLVIVALRMSMAALIGAGVFAFATLLATLGLGEHYFVDLVVALPFVVAVHALVSLFDGHAGKRRSATVALAAGLLFTAWLPTIELGTGYLREIPWVASSFVLGTIIVSVWLVALMEHGPRLQTQAPVAGSTPLSPREAEPLR